MRTKRRDQGTETGQSLPEFAFTMPLLIALLVSVIAIAWIGFNYMSLASAARIGARHLIGSPYFDEASIDTEVEALIYDSLPVHNSDQITVTIAPAPADRDIGTMCTVQITYQMQNPTIQLPFIIDGQNIVLLAPIQLQSTSRMRID